MTPKNNKIATKWLMDLCIESNQISKQYSMEHVSIRI